MRTANRSCQRIFVEKSDRHEAMCSASLSGQKQKSSRQSNAPGLRFMTTAEPDALAASVRYVRRRAAFSPFGADQIGDLPH